MFLWLYDRLHQRRWLLLILWMMIIAVAGFMASHIHLKEDIGDFLTSDADAARYMSVYQQIGGQNRIVIITSAPTVGEDARTDTIASAMADFEEMLQAVDTAAILQDIQMQTDESSIADMVSFFMAHAPLLMSDADYQRADSLLESPNYIAQALDDNRQTLLLPTSGFMVQSIQHDPLHLFSPVLARLNTLRDGMDYVVEDGIIFTPDRQAGIGFVTSPFGSSESGNNRLLATLLNEAIDRLQQAHPAVRVTAVGAPLIAVANADRIKADGILAGIISVVLIGLILWLRFRRIGDIVWMVLSIATGYAIAIAIMGIYRDELSVIVLGTGSVLIGIAANYPLHFLDHTRHEPNRRKALSDMVPPLLTGNITTVSAFACLAWMDSEAMRDLGILGALVLMATILFVLVFLPVLASRRNKNEEIRMKNEDPTPHSSFVIRHSSFFILHSSFVIRHSSFFTFHFSFFTLLLLTCIFGYFSLQTTFDTNMQHINYMTDEQRENLSLLGIGLESAGGQGVLAVAEAQDMETALQRAEQMTDSLQRAGHSVKSLHHLIPSQASQQRAIEGWQRLIAKHGNALRTTLLVEGQRQGFSSQAFAPFLAMLDATWEPMPLEAFSDITDVVGGQYILTSDHQPTRVISYVQDSVAMPDADKALWRQRLCEQGFLFDSRDMQSTLATTLSDDFNYIGFVCGFVVFFFLWLSFGSIELSLLSFLPLAVGWIWILGIMQLCGIQFNIVNIILATFIFGQGDDYTIFMTDGLVCEHTYGRPVLRSYKESVTLSAIIMFIGIGTLIFAQHPAMRSLAQVVIIGMFTVVLMAFYLPPLVFRWLTREKGQLREVPLTMERFLVTLFASCFYLGGAIFYQPFAFLYSHLGRYTEARRLRFHKTLQAVSRFCISHIPGTSFTVHNPHGETLERPAVIVCNHQSQLDLMAVLSFAPKVVILTKKWVWNNPLYALILRAAEFYPISEGYEQSQPHLESLILRGYSIVVFPEGTRSVDREIHRFHQGAFHLAKTYGLDILPVFLVGLGDVLPKDELAFRRGQMHMEIGQRIAADDAAWGSTPRETTRLVHRLFLTHYAELRRQFATVAAVVPYVRYQYKYKVRSVEREASRRLNEILANAAAIEQWTCGTEHHITACGQGEEAFVFALVHPDIQVIATDPDPEKLEVARHVNIHLSNLRFEN